MFWIILGTINVLLAHLADRNFYSKKAVCWCWLSIIILINTFFIGLRDYKVGIDTSVYIDLYFDYASSLSSVSEFLSNDMSYDQGFVVLAYLSSLFSSDSHSLMIFTELFIMVFLTMGLMGLKKSIDFRLSCFFLLFWLLFNNETFNLMRQFCAMSLLFYGYSQFIQKRYMVYAIAQITAYFFHSSSVLFLLIPCFEYLSKQKGKIKYYYAFTVFIGGIIMLFAYYAILFYIVDLGILKEVYFDRYGMGAVFTADETNIGIRYTIQRVIPPFVFYVLYKKRLVTPQFMYMLLVLYVVYVLLDAMRFVMIYFFRLGYYAGLVFIVYYSNTLKYLKYTFPYQFLFFLLILFVAIGNYSVKTEGVGAHYSSKILNIQ